MRQRVLPVDPALRQVVRPVCAERQRPVALGANEQPADVGVLTESRQEARMPLLDLLAGETAPLPHQVDEAEVARSEHDYLLVRDVVLRAFLLPRAAGRLADRVADVAVVLVSTADARHGAALELPLDDPVEAVPGPLLERR